MLYKQKAVDYADITTPAAGRRRQSLPRDGAIERLHAVIRERYAPERVGALIASKPRAHRTSQGYGHV